MGLENSLFLLYLIRNEIPEQHHRHWQMNCITQMNDPAKINPTLNQKNKTKIVSQNEIYSQEKIQSRLKLEIIGSRLDPSQSLSLQ